MAAHSCHLIRCWNLIPRRIDKNNVELLDKIQQYIHKLRHVGEDKEINVNYVEILRHG